MYIMLDRLQGVFTKKIILSDPENIRKIYLVNWDDSSGNPDLAYRSREHWQSVTVSLQLSAACQFDGGCGQMGCPRSSLSSQTECISQGPAAQCYASCFIFVHCSCPLSYVRSEARINASVRACKALWRFFLPIVCSWACFLIS